MVGKKSKQYPKMGILSFIYEDKRFGEDIMDKQKS